MGVLREYLIKIGANTDLTFDESKKVCKYLLKGEATEAEMGGFLLSLKTKGEVDAEIAGLATGMKEEAKKFRKIKGFVMDNCGTGGDNLGTFNISTTCSFVLSGGGIKIAKHGNRSISSKSGSSDILSELGVNININETRVEDILENVGIVFLFAPLMHPMLKNVMKTRLDLQVPTVLNLLGPLINPVDLNGQLMGVYSRELVPRMARILSLLGRENAMVVSGYGGMDEASLEGENHIAILKNGKIKEDVIRGIDYGFKIIDNSKLKGGDPRENAVITKNILLGEKGPGRDIVVFNSALGFLAAGIVSDIQEGIELSRNTIDSGRAIEKLNLLIKESNR